MIEILIGAVVAIIVAGLVIFAYAKGVRTGMSISKGEPPEKVKIPVIKKAKEEKSTEESFEDQLAELSAAQPQFIKE